MPLLPSVISDACLSQRSDRINELRLDLRPNTLKELLMCVPEILFTVARKVCIVTSSISRVALIICAVAFNSSSFFTLPFLCNCVATSSWKPHCRLHDAFGKNIPQCIPNGTEIKSGLSAGLHCANVASFLTGRLRFLSYCTKENLCSALEEQRPLWQTCSLVANSPPLLERACGNLVDEADAVFRFNWAGTSKFVERNSIHVGRKTTIVLTGKPNGNNHKTLHKLIDRKAVLFLGLRSGGKRDASIKQCAHCMYYDLEVLQRSAASLTHADNSRIRTATTGLVAFPFAFRFCRGIRLFGYQWDPVTEYRNSYGQLDASKKMTGIINEEVCARANILSCWNKHTCSSTDPYHRNFSIVSQC